MTRHLLDIDDLGPDEVAGILALARLVDPPQVLAGRGAALIFQKPSNRTRNATEMAVVALGGHPVTIRGEEVGLGERESVEDVVRTLAQYHAVIGARVNDHRTLEAMASASPVPVVNLLSDRSHPCQALADLLTLEAHWGGLGGRTVAWVGDGNNVARSLVHACARTGTTIRLASPPGHQLDELTVEAARNVGGEVVLTGEPMEAATGADAVCTDVWVSMGQEGEERERRGVFQRFQVDEALMEVTAPGAAFLHCLPAHRGQEVTAGVIDGPASLVWAQAGNRMHAARGLLLWLAGVGAGPQPAGRPEPAEEAAAGPR